MDILSLEFFTALAAIVVIDLVLAGDNAIVIALAARNVAPHLRKKAIVFGAAGAVVARSAMTLAVVWLLAIPGLMLAGGLALVWIAWKLLLPEHDGDEAANIKVTSSFWGAIRTIVVADIVMGVDNVIGVAGAAHGNFLLVVLGLIISIPIVVWGSSILLKWMERWPFIIYIGAGVLAFTAAKMITHESLIEHVFDENLAIHLALYAVIVGGVLYSGYAARQRAALRPAAGVESGA